MSDIYGEYVPPEIAVTVEGQEISVSVVQGLKGEDGADGVTINTLTEKEALVDNDLILIEDSEASNAQKKVKVSTVRGGKYDYLNILIDNGDDDIETGVACYLMVGARDIVANYVLGHESGSIQFDLWVDTFANFPPTVADTITASAKPALSSGQSSSDATLTGWTSALAEGSVLAVNVDSCSGVKKCTLVLKVTRF